MKFKVGPWFYRVRISDGQLRDDRNRAMDGLCCYSDRTIWVNGVLPLQQRADVLTHELAHAWIEAFGQPGDAEGFCNFVSSFTTDVRRQFERQGGADALMRLRVDGVIDSELSVDSENDAYAVQCGNCGSLIAIGSVTNSPARYDAAHGRAVMERVATCADCGLKTSWIESCTAGGRPSGRVLDGPRVESIL